MAFIILSCLLVVVGFFVLNIVCDAYAKGFRGFLFGAASNFILATLMILFSGLNPYLLLGVALLGFFLASAAWDYWQNPYKAIRTKPNRS